MMKILKASMGVLVFLTCVVAIGASENLAMIPGKSRIEFTGTKPGKQHDGGFKRLSVSGNIDWSNLANSRVRVEIDTSSLWSDDGGLTSHLKGADFFNVAQFPQIVFEANSVQISGERTANVAGKLSMLGKEVDIEVPCNLELSDGALVVRSTFKIDRALWGMTYGRSSIDQSVAIRAVLAFGR